MTLENVCYGIFTLSGILLVLAFFWGLAESKTARRCTALASVLLFLGVPVYLIFVDSPDLMDTMAHLFEEVVKMLGG